MHGWNRRGWREARFLCPDSGNAGWFRLSIYPGSKRLKGASYFLRTSAAAKNEQDEQADNFLRHAARFQSA